ncbi:DUF1501 domain-containing protein [Blastopirellula marina]|uniref:DUF1501 domain-containing protein n=2 Tax=Blastopirellula marina TaxID=124 RepID=A0A2S8FND4_9BACT|nr:DUF1501 domain-containing protein [Blastopirellula marina]PTL43488.1 DUF1501 domain-containing protein [Blastopirellula marina]
MPRHDRREPARRSFLKLGTAFGLSLSAVLRRQSAGAPTKPSRATAQNMILIWLGGGPATIDMWDMKPSASSMIRGEFQPISTTLPGLQICEHMPQLAKLMHKCTLIRSLKHAIPAHGPGSQYLITGNLPSAAVEYPSLGSVTAKMLDSLGGVPSYVTFGDPPSREAGYLGSAWNPFELDASLPQLPEGISLGADADLTAFQKRVRLRDLFDRQFDSRNADRVASGIDAFQQQAVDVLRQDTVRKALDIETVPDEVKQRYGTSTVGTNAIRARRLIEAGARFVTVGVDGWDTHVNNFTQLRTNLLPQLDKALAGLIFDLDRRGMLNETVVCCCGEFGRTPQVNASAGRDHWSSAMSLLLAGGGFREGYVHGATNPTGTEVSDSPLGPADLAATILSRLGIDPATHTQTSSGRTMPIVRNGRIVEDLLMPAHAT